MAERGRHPAGRLRWLVPPAAAAAAGGLAWLAGVDGGHVVGIALAAASVTAGTVWAARTGPGPWPEEPPGSHGAGWHQVALATASLVRAERDPARAPSLVDRRLRTLAGTAPHDPGVQAALQAPGTPTARVLAVLDALEAAGGPGAAGGSRVAGGRSSAR